MTNHKNFIDLNKINFKKSTGSHDDFLMLRNIHTVSMKNNVIKSIGHWDEKFQKDRLSHIFNQTFQTLEFIQYEGETIGTINCSMQIDQNSNDNCKQEKIFIYIEQFYLLPNYQKKGIGSFIFNTRLSGKEARLSVLKNDKETQQFYIKQGFVEYYQDDYQTYMKKLAD